MKHNSENLIYLYRITGQEQNCRLELLAYNEAWPRLFAEIAQRKRFYLMERYVDSLMKWNPEETTKCCCDCLNREMNFASDRNMYRSVFHRMALLKGYPGGQDIINSLLTLWQEAYPRRSAMLDEMKKARKEKVI